MASASGYNHHRFARSVLKKSRKWEPSLTVQLYPSYWKFADSPPEHNSPYDGPLKPFLLALRAQVISAPLMPFLYEIQPPVSFVDGCLVVEIQDYRKFQDGVRSRVVMRPAAESLAQTIDCMLERRGEVWDEQLALELESRIISATSPPLYLGTSILPTRNAVLSMSLTSPATSSLTSDGRVRHPTQSSDSSSISSSDKMRRLIKAGERVGAFVPTFSVVRHIQNQEAKKKAEEEARIREIQMQNNPGMYMNGASQGNGNTSGVGGAGGGGAGGKGGKDSREHGHVSAWGNGSIGGPGGSGNNTGSIGDQNTGNTAAPKKKKKKRAASEDEEDEPAKGKGGAAKAKKKKAKVDDSPEVKGKGAGKGVKKEDEEKPKKKPKKKKDDA